MAAEVYVVETTLVPGVQYRVSLAEYQHLIELGILDTLVEVIVPADRVLIQSTEPASPQVGAVWFNTSVP